MQWMVWLVLLGVLVACGGGNPGQNTDRQTNSQPSAPEAVGTSTATEPQQAAAEPVPFITPRPVRAEEPLSPDQRNIPSVFPGIDAYHAVEATIRTEPQPFQSPANPEEAAKAVVQIYRCINNNCDSAVGSGVIIHPSGIIATAYHVLLRNPANPNSGPFDDESDDTDNIVIALTSDVFAPAEPRFQARIAATKVDQDLALLQIVRDLQGNAIVPGDLTLPALPVADVTNLFDREFRVLGYLTNGSEPISIERVNFRRSEDEQRLVVVN
ncbi:MAG: trypsin-like peptidase domain-containing protein, partial [Caldilineaceae bacterium]|nr:trypsin-like peptidase domain-containing protein [Caldilineaceae bacterium]